jgi:hypothetical protein
VALTIRAQFRCRIYLFGSPGFDDFSERRAVNDSFSLSIRLKVMDSPLFEYSRSSSKLRRILANLNIAQENSFFVAWVVYFAPASGGLSLLTVPEHLH